MLFYQTTPSETNTGLKYVLWEVKNDNGHISYDWGFCEWMGFEWGDIEVPEGFTVKVEWWANTVDPNLLLKEPTKIIRLS